MTFELGPILDHLGVEFDADKLTNQKVNCPIHEDAVASASVNLEEGLINCFGCDLRGDAITLIMETEGLEFVEAKRLVESLSRETGDSVPRGAYAGGTYLPGRKRTRPGRRAWKSPWARKRP